MKKILFLLYSFLSIHCVYTADINLKNIGKAGEYQVFVDDSFIGVDLTTIAIDTDGMHMIEIKQNRFGTLQVIDKQKIVLNGIVPFEMEFEIPYLLKDERLLIGRNRKNIEKAINKNLSIGSLMFEITQILNSAEDLSFCPVLIDERNKIQGYFLLLQIESEVRNAIDDFNNEIPINLQFFNRIIDFSSFGEISEEVRNFFQSSLQKILILKRLECIIALKSEDYETFIERRDQANSLFQLAALVSDPFALQYRMDMDYLSKLYAVFVEDKKNRSKRELNNQLEAYYGSIWLLSERIILDELDFDRTQLLAFKLNYSNLELLSEIPVADESFKSFQWNTSIGGGSLVTSGVTWQPWKWLGLNLGVSFAADFVSKQIVTVPLEVNFIIIQKPVKIFLGATVDLFRLQNMATTHWSHFWLYPNSPDLNPQSRFSMITAVGINAGIGVNIGRTTIYLNNYIYLRNLDNPGFSFDQLVYSPAIGITF